MFEDKYIFSYLSLSQALENLAKNIKMENPPQLKMFFFRLIYLYKNK